MPPMQSFLFFVGLPALCCHNNTLPIPPTLSVRSASVLLCTVRVQRRPDRTDLNRREERPSSACARVRASGANNAIIGTVPAVCENAPYGDYRQQIWDLLRWPSDQAPPPPPVAPTRLLPTSPYECLDPKVVTQKTWHWTLVALDNQPTVTVLLAGPQLFSFLLLVLVCGQKARSAASASTQRSVCEVGKGVEKGAAEHC